jgi:hypothetical protein
VIGTVGHDERKGRSLSGIGEVGAGRIAIAIAIAVAISNLAVAITITITITITIAGRAACGGVAC